MNENRVGIRAKVIADSLFGSRRLTTFELTFPRFILAEFNTHRVLSRNSASSRAIPVWKRLADVLEHPFVPSSFGKNKAGMQAVENLSLDDAEQAQKTWLLGRDLALVQAYLFAGGEEQIMQDAKGSADAAQLCESIKELARMHQIRNQPLKTAVHKQLANRVTEPFSYHTVITTATKWRNFYGLRASVMAQPEIQELAISMAKAHLESRPAKLKEGEWHLPYIFDEDRMSITNPMDLARVSSGRCARVSYLTHDGKRDCLADMHLADRLQKSGHVSPFEHPAKASILVGMGGNFGYGWEQYRAMLPGERDFTGLVSREELLSGFKNDEALVDFVLMLPE